ncbi:hypothetical protein WR25_22811 isoform B [Diploscapter pachys]|uniref:Uncharacterized protein n=1 Tax=Diploscapter pachys TaxID=2018661 RepID=A0A2A2JJH0_9BILA|nr:hypothetical protein WR25_22811 isoform A [Diploscapter pachys]PAV61887.1 hypothetical protein WR25_22811 isoform B [Diploscapter pachys]
MIYWFYPTSILCFLLAFASVTFNNSPDIFINFAVKYQVILSILHSVLLSVSAIVSAFCCYLCANLANDVGKYAYHATPAQFQHASNWYFQRLRISGLIFALESVLSLLVLCVLYLGIQCRYRTFAQVPTKSVPDIIQKTTTFFQ